MNIIKDINTVVPQSHIAKSIRKMIAKILIVSSVIMLPIQSYGVAYADESDDNKTYTSGVMTTSEESLYATTDYYGNLLESSVVKTYNLNGATSITDYGAYDSVKNLTNDITPQTSETSTTFVFDKDNIPSKFYFEGDTTIPYKNLPWNISLTYKLNGVTKNAEELAGEKGEVEITVDVMPNKAASEYASNNFILAAAAMFNQNDILSLDAPDAQVMTVGNIKTAAFLALPGEEQHFVLRVGSDSFKFGGMTFIMGPVNSDRISEITDLRADKEEIEDSYDKLNDSLDALLDSLDTMKAGLKTSANGLDELDKVRGNVYKNKDEMYADIDRIRQDLINISGSIDPATGHINSAQDTIDRLKDNLDDVSNAMIDVGNDVEDLEIMMNLYKQDTLNAASIVEDMQPKLDKLATDADAVKSYLQDRSTYQEISQILNTMDNLYDTYEASAATPSDAGFKQFATVVMKQNGYSNEEIRFCIALWENEALVRKTMQAAIEASDDAVTIIDDITVLSTQDAQKLVQDLLSHTYQSTVTGKQASGHIVSLIDRLDNTHSIIDNYLPELKSTLTDMDILTTHLKSTVDDTYDIVTFVEEQMKANDSLLDDGTHKTLSGVADVLRKLSNTIDATDKTREAKQSITDLIDDKWDEYTGEKSNIFLMDPTASPESFTSDKNNEGLTDISVMIRTQEIKEDKEAEETVEKTTESTTLLDRIVKMFTDIWNMITGLFTGNK